MGNVLRLFEQKKVEDRSASNTVLRIAIADILSSNVELARAVKELSVHFDALDRLIDGLTDAGTRTQFKRLASQARLELTVASVRLSRRMEQFLAMKKQLEHFPIRLTIF